MGILRRVIVPLSACAFAGATIVVVAQSSPAIADSGCPTATPPTLVGGSYEIDSAAKLQWAKDSAAMSNDYVLTADVDMSGCTWSNGIGSSGAPFTGDFDGNGRTISNLTISGGNTQNLGLFDYLNGSVFDLTIASPSVTGTNDFVAPVAGQLGASGSISNVTATSVTVSASQFAGGIVGKAWNGSTITTVTVSGSVTATGTWAGGIAAFAEATISQATSSATVSGSSNIGGLVGQLSSAGSLTSSQSTGNVSGSSDSVGGAVGSAVGSRPTCATLTSVTTSGTITSTLYVGGLVGYGNCYFVNQSSSSASVTATSQHAGGLVGYENYAGNITRSYFTGQVQAPQVAGGLGGLLRSVIVDSYSTGSVTVTTSTNGGRAGGLVGWFRNSGAAGDPAASITNSYASGLVTSPSSSDSNVGGLIGEYGGGTITAGIWDMTTTGRSSSNGTGARGFTTQQLRDYVLFDSDNLNWNITDGISSGNGVSTGTAWSVCSGANSGYPFLTWQGLSGTCRPTMAYNGNTNTSGTAPVDGSTPYTSGMTVTVAGNTGSLAKTGNIFAGWNTKADGTGFPYSPGDTFTITAPVMLFATWTTSPTIRYFANGGSGTITGQTGTSGSTVTLSTGANFTRSGYLLSRWDTSSLGTGTSYALGQSVTMPANGMVLHAVWEVDPSATTTTTTTVPSSSTSTPPVTSPAASPGSPTTTIAGNSSSGTGNSSQSGSTGSGTPAPVAGTTTTTVISTTTTSVVSNDVPDIEGVESGDVGATLNGRPVTTEVTEDDGSVIVTVGGATVRYTVVDASGLPRPLSMEEVVALQPGDTVTVQLNGFADEAEATVWLAPGDDALGSTTLSGGTGIITSALPSDVTGGSRRIVTSAASRTGEPLVVAYGVEITGSGNDGPSWSLVFLVFLGLAVAGGLLVPAVRRRRDKDD